MVNKDNCLLVYLASTRAALLAVQRFSECNRLVIWSRVCGKHFSLSIHSLPSWLSAWQHN